MFRLAALRFAAAARPAVPRALTASARVTMPTMRLYSAGGALSRSDIQARIFQLLQDFDKVNQEKLSPTADFSKELGLDSLDTVEVVMAIEEEFSVEIPDDEADKISSVKEAIDYITKREDAH
ncbi:mitochondrial acyl carrier protein [Coemansia sp. RSA 1807]|nr:mitochondrial acyl carrier protein [Coemansia sp. RSA 1752]KAJ2129074.1 mitochondrial acyl carrier protein [Coemansia sp. RSA 788]KAJ2141085.1 mitochondrial acyl carrier protein [Coemansia sp. RSA 564]KAJ2166500.1 mitochondrial acyl carrier protein [Coemansia sp. RSA 551]KAJ2175187.1 mitochondrial acyl carrier protein [Coemansia sp. RSA 532]KAJ2193784.1 mitochondrial acyl carrier protein [Coemansia sp. RSA 530]KAJ2201463.1 mitochondrial acyl carrier protein [Coemansia sp. RSA 522]KAJ22317